MKNSLTLIFLFFVVISVVLYDGRPQRYSDFTLKMVEIISFFFMLLFLFIGIKAIYTKKFTTVRGLFARDIRVKGKRAQFFGVIHLMICTLIFFVIFFDFFIKFIQKEIFAVIIASLVVFPIWWTQYLAGKKNNW